MHDHVMELLDGNAISVASWGNALTTNNLATSTEPNLRKETRNEDYAWQLGGIQLKCVLGYLQSHLYNLGHKDERLLASSVRILILFALNFSCVHICFHV